MSDGGTVVIIGGSSGIGLATAQAVQRAGMRPIIIGRDAGKLAKAVATIGPDTKSFAADAADRPAIERAFASIGTFDHLVVAASGGRGGGPFGSVAEADLRAGFDAKFWAHWNAAQAALGHLPPNGAITIITGASARAAHPGTSGLAAINGALGSMVRTLARELAPIRINAVSPGIILTPWWADKPEGAFEAASQLSPLKRSGTAEEVAEAILFVIKTAYVTGITLDIDGGLHLT